MTLNCAVIVRAKDKNRAVRHVLTLLGVVKKPPAMRVEVYDKVPGCFRGEFALEVEVGTVEAEVFEVLRLATRWAAKGWSFDGPNAGPGVVMTLYLNNQRAVEPLVWACIEMWTDAAQGISIPRSATDDENTH